MTRNLAFYGNIVASVAIFYAFQWCRWPWLITEKPTTLPQTARTQKTSPSADQNSDRKIATGNAIIYTPDVEGTKAEADAKRARRAKIVFIILDIVY